MNGHDHGIQLVRCPACGVPSPAIKQYVLCNLLVFVFVMAFTRRATYTSCGPCMRRTILERSAINLITAHVLWPIIVLPWHTVQFIRSYSEGHSSGIWGD